LACAIPAAAQQAPETVIRTTTRLVEVRVAAYDAKGRPVSGLKRDDFLVFDSGKQQPITLFAAESAVAGKPAAAGQAANAAAASAKRDDSAVILLDWINTSLGDRVRAFDALKKLLKTFQPNQKTAVYALAPELRIVHQFTTETDELLGAIEDTGFDTGSPEILPPGSVAYPGTRIGGGASEIQLMELDKRIRDGLDAFGALADRLAHMPGRKSLIWLSDGLPMMIDGTVVPGAHPGEYTYFAEVEGILAKLNRADIAVYSVNAAGLATSATKTVPHNLMFEVSRRTGGTVFADRNDLDNGIRAALEDIDISYTLGFAVPEDARPGLHAIQVRVNRGGLQLRYRESYALDAPAK
jgi:VWFA-related protein